MFVRTLHSFLCKITAFSKKNWKNENVTVVHSTCCAENSAALLAKQRLKLGGGREGQS